MSPVDVLLVGEPQAMARLRRSLRGGQPALRVTVARDPKSFETGLRSKRMAVAVVQQPQGWDGEESPAGRIRERWPGCAVLGWVESGHTPPQIEAARAAGLDGLLFEDGSTPEALRLQLHLAAGCAAERGEALEARARYRSLFDHVPVGLYRTSARGDILEANAELARMLRYPDREALRALKASGLYARRRDRKRILDGQRDESVLHAPEVELRRSDGESVWVEDHARPLRDAAGEIIAYEGSLLDVTERRRLELELRASEERFRALVQNASDVIAVVSERGEIEYISPSSSTQFGYRPEELIGRIAFDFIHPEDLAHVGQAYGEVLQRSNPGTPTEFRFLHAAGHWIDVETVASNLLDQPAVAGIVMTTRVVTERKQAEGELRESRRRLSTLLGNLPGMAYRCRNDPQWTMELVSEGCLELTGFPAVDLQANRVVSYASLIHPEDRDSVWRAVQAAVEDGRRFQLSYRILTAEGDERWVWEQGGAVGTAADGTPMLEGFIADITDRRAAEDELRTSRAWLQHIVEAVDDVLVVYDAEGHYVDVITGDDSLLMRPVSDMLGRTVAEVLPAEIAERFLTGIRIVLAQGASYEFEYPLDLPRGVRWFRARGRRIRESESGGLLTLWSITDTTERKETEQALLRQGRQLELLSRISQQLNTVLEIPAVLRTLVASGMDLVDASAGTAGVWTGEVMRFSEYNRDGLLEPIDSALAPGVGVPGVVAQTRSSYLANDPHADTLLASAGKDLGIRNLINVPIISREGALLGCLEVHNRRRGEPFNESDVSILEGLASNAAVALENAQLLAERLRAEEELRQIKEFNEDIVLSMGEGILVQDRLGAFTFVNPAAAAMLGYAPDELLQAPWTRIVPPDQHAIVGAVDADRERGKTSRYEIEFVRKDGTRLPALVSGSPRFRDGRFDGMLAVFADLTDRAAAEEALRESEQQFRSVAERSPSMIFINQAGRIVYVNARCSEMMGYPQEQFLAPEFRFESLVAPESLATVRQAFARHARGEDVEPYEYGLITRPGRRLTVINATKLIAFRGQPAILGVITDITDRQRAEAALRASEARFRAFFAYSAMGIALTDGEGRVLESNAAFQAILGQPAGAESGRPVWEWIHTDDAGLTHSLYTDLCQERRGPFQLEIRFGDPSGHLTPTRATVSRIPGDGDQTTAIWMVENVAERKRAEEAVRESERRFRLLVERAADAVFLHDMQGAIVDVNQQACESLGYTRDELLKLAVRDIEAAVPEDEQRGLWKTLTAGAPQTLQGAHRRKDGSVFPVELRIGSFDIDGRPYILSLARDVTERQRAEAALRETTEMLQALVQAAPVGVTVFDLEGRVRLWNPAAERIFRISAEHILDQGLEALRDLRPENVAAFTGVMQEVLQGRPVSDIEVEAIRSDGVPVDVAISAAPLRDSGGSIRALMGVLEDVTERKRAEAAIRRHTRELAVLYETSLDVARRSDVEDILQVIVDQAAGLMGAEMGGIYLMRDDSPELELVVIHNLPAQYRGVRLALGEGLSGRVAQTGEAQAVTNYATWEGRSATYEGAVFRRVAAAPLKRAGKVIGIINVTDNTRTDPFEADELRVLQLFADQAAIVLENARLFEETRRRAAHLEAITSVAAGLRASGRRDQMMPVILARLQELVGAEGALLALEDRATREIVVPAASGAWSSLTGMLPPGAAGIFADVMAGGRPTWELQAGTEAWESLPPSVRELPAVALVPLVEQEKVVGLFGIGRREPFGDAERSLLLALAEVVGSALHRADVLETLEQRVQVRTRELAEANERLTELDRLKSNFVSNVSHELRTPITNVLLYLDLLQQPGREERRPTYLQVLRHESERLGHLIEDLLTLSRVDQEALKISRELRSLDPLLGEVAAAHRARAQAKNVALTLEPNPDVPPAWIGYQPMIQVFNNLVANAVAYTQPGGSVTLGSLVYRSAQGETQVGARVWNDGPPIPPEDIPQLFQRFFRGRTGRESGEPGTGLGLSICKEIVDRHGGRIDVVSSEEQGTSFTVWLPIGVEG